MNNLSNNYINKITSIKIYFSNLLTDKNDDLH